MGTPPIRVTQCSHAPAGSRRRTNPRYAASGRMSSAIALWRTYPFHARAATAPRSSRAHAPHPSGLRNRTAGQPRSARASHSGAARPPGGASSAHAGQSSGSSVCFISSFTFPGLQTSDVPTPMSSSRNRIAFAECTWIVVHT